MVDVTTKKPLTVTPNSGVWPYLRLPFVQLAEVERLLTDRGVRYAVEDGVISFNGGPEIAVIRLGRNGDAAAVQAILDSV